MTDDSLLGRQFDEYRLVALLGRGGMARVYRALDVRLKRFAAVKVIDASLRGESDYWMRFEREAQAIAQLEHPHIVRLYRFGEAGGLLYMAMQYIDGADLATVLHSYRADGEFIAPEDASRLIREVCSALDYAHSKGVIHRDVKPSNIMLDRDGHAILTDFGLALLTELGTRGEIFGSPHYIAPEQAISSARVKPQSDLYSVGVMVYEMFTGQLPFTAESSLDIAMLHLTEPPRPPRELRPELHPAAEAAILKALSKEPGGRYPSGVALADALDSALRLTVVRRPALHNRPTIADRVAAGTAENPAYQLAAQTPAREPSLPDQPTAPAASASPAKRRPIATLSCLGLLVMIAIVLIVAGALARAGAVSQTAQATPTEIQPIAGSLATVTETPGPIPIPTNEPAETAASPESRNTAASTYSPTPSLSLTPTPFPSSTASPAELLIVKNTKEGFFIINQSQQTVMLEDIRLEGNKPEQIEGEDWDRETLGPGECVGVWQKRGAPELPGGVTCQRVGERLRVDDPEKFWSPEIRVYYRGDLLGVCTESETRCSVPLK